MIPKEAVTCAKRKFDELRKDYPYRNAHPSHAVVKALEHVDDYFRLEGYGVEGSIEPVEFQYINMGDPYVETLMYSEELGFFISAWGDFVEEKEAQNANV